MLHRSKRLNNPEFRALQAVKENYRQTKDLDAALDAGYELIKDSYDLDTWLDFAKTAIQKAPDGTRISIIKGSILAQNQRTLDDVKKSKEDLIPDEELDAAINEVDQISKNPPRKPNSFFLTPRAEDFEGLLYTLLPKGPAGKKMKETFDKYLTNPYNKAIENLYEQHSQYLAAWKDATRGVKLNEKLPGMEHNLGDAIKVASLIKQGKETGLDPDTEAQLLAAVDGELGDVMEAFDALGLDLTQEDLNTKDPIAKSINKQIVAKIRKQQLQTFNKNLDALGLNPNTDSDVWRNLEENLGRDYVGALKGTLRRMKSGKNRSSTTPANPFLKWLGVATSTTMFWNGRSAVLQMLSAFNFMGLPNNNVLQAAGAAANFPQFYKDVKKLWNTPYLKDRQKGAKFDVLADELAGDDAQSWMTRTVNKIFTGKFGGFAPTRLVDSFAIASGGAAFYRNTINALKKQDPTLTDKQAEAIAYSKWTQQAEKTQQSADPSKVSEIQADELGKIFFAFANTPFQYARYAKRKLQDVAQGRSENRRKDIQTAFYYTAGQTAIFTGLQTGAIALAMSDDDDTRDDKAQLALERAITGMVKPLGYGGAATATGLSIAAELYRQKYLGYRADDARIAESFLAASPVLSAKFRNLKQAAKKFRKEDNLGAAAEFGEFTTGLPAARVMKKYDNFKEALELDNKSMEKWMRLAGWSKWDFVNFGPKDPYSFDFDTDFDTDFDVDFDTPLDRQETGQAFKDGTIEVDPNLSPIEREKTIAHEQEHVRQMNEDGLDYDEGFVYYKGNKHERKNGQINYNGKWMPEGDKKFPWEAHAYEAESPVARIDDKDKKKEDEKYIRNPEHIEQVNKSRDRFKQHYSDPVTEELYRQNTGFNDLPSKIDNALDTRIQTGFVPQGAKATYDPAIGDYKGAITVGDYRDPAVVDHELTHAAGFDEALGKEAQKILGKPKSGDKYLSKPSEVYGNLHEFRTRLDLKGFERNLSPKKVQDLIKFNELEDDPDIKQMIDEFGLDKLSEALNKIASNKDKPTLEGLYG